MNFAFVRIYAFKTPVRNSRVSFMNMRQGDLKESLGVRLLLSRRDLDWDQAELAKKSGVSRGHISKIERGDIDNLTITVAFALADALGISRSYLLGISDIVTTEGDDKEDLDALTREFITIYQQLSDDKKGILLNLARMLRNSDAPRIIGSDED